jgi:mannitol 2-dehydrogenase
VHDECQDPLFAEFLLAYMDREATPDAARRAGIDLHAYKRSSSSASPTRRCATRRAAVRGELRPHPEVAAAGDPHNLEHDGEIDRAVLVVAAWARYAEGVDEQGEPITIVDRLADTLKATAQTQRDDPLAFVRNRELFGDLVDDERFASTYQRFLASLHEKGARATLEDLAGQ